MGLEIGDALTTEFICYRIGNKGVLNCKHSVL